MHLRCVLMLLGLVALCSNSFADTKKETPSKKEVPTADTSADPRFMPSVEDVSDSTVEAPTDQDIQKLKDSRWLEPAEFKKPDKDKGKEKDSKISLKSSCTDASGNTHNAGDAGYNLCVQQASEDGKTSGRVHVNDDKREGSSSGKPSVGAGFEYKFDD